MLSKSSRAVEIATSALRDAVRRLVRAYEPRRIYLFGSSARGDADGASDYDLMVEVPDSAPSARRRTPETALKGFLAWHDQPFDAAVALLPGEARP